MDLLEDLQFDERSRVPKYRQIVTAVIDGISSGQLAIDEKIPSINAFSEHFDLSRDTVEKAYNILKERNIITSVRGKGYYVARTKLLGKVNVLFLLNKLSTYKMQVYNSFVDALGANGHTDMHVYHCDESLFLNLLRKGRNAYDYYVVMPHFHTSGGQHVSATEPVLELLRDIPRHKLVVLDNDRLPLDGHYSCIYQDFEEDLYTALREHGDRLEGYRRLVLSFPRQSLYPYPKRILRGFRRYCSEARLPFEVVDGITPEDLLEAGTLYLTIPEGDLVNLVKLSRDQGLEIGRDIGVISYNETPLKDLLGITTVSTDFRSMGRRAAEVLLERTVIREKNPFRLVDRASL